MDIKRVIKYRLQAGSKEVIDDLEGISVEELVFATYLPINDEDTRRLVRFFDEQLVLAKINPQRFIETRYDKLREIVQWIKDNHKYRVFSNFASYVFRNINANIKVLAPYQCVLLEVWGQVAPFNQWWYGLDENDNPMFMDELYGAYDVEQWELIENVKRGKISKTLAIKKEQEIEEKTRFSRFNDRNIGNTVYQMLGLINPRNQDFIFPFRDWFNHGFVQFILPRMYKETSYYLELLNQRSFLLNPEGVVVKVFNAGMFGEIRFLEQFVEDGMIVLYRVTHAKEKDKHSMGYIDLRFGFIYSPFDYMRVPEEYQERYKNFILEVYTHLTTQFPKDIKRVMALKEFDSEDDKLDLYPEQPGIYCVVKESKSVESHSHHSSTTNITLHSVSGHLRRANPSEIALANARQYGIIVPPGYTFIKPHQRGKSKL